MPEQLQSHVEQPAAAPNAKTLPSVFTDDETIVTAEFDVTNSKDRPLHIMEVVRSCGCASVSLGKPEIAPRETTKLKVAINMTRFSGKRTVRCVLIGETEERLEFSASVTGIADYRSIGTSLRLAKWTQEKPPLRASSFIRTRAMVSSRRCVLRLPPIRRNSGA